MRVKDPQFYSPKNYLERQLDVETAKYARKYLATISSLECTLRWRMQFCRPARDATIWTGTFQPFRVRRQQ